MTTPNDSRSYFELPDGPKCLLCRVDMDLEERTGNRCDYLCTKCCKCERCKELAEIAAVMIADYWREEQ